MSKICLGWVLVLGVACGCTAEHVVSEHERQRQAAVESMLAELLFDEGLTDVASYRVRKDGSIAIKFDRTVAPPVFTAVVQQLRRHPQVSTVYAEQDGAEVCRLP